MPARWRTWHAAGVKFNEPIPPKPFVSPAEWDRLPSSNPIRPESLTGQVLMIDDQDVERMLFAYLLRPTKLAVTGVADLPRRWGRCGRSCSTGSAWT